MLDLLIAVVASFWVGYYLGYRKGKRSGLQEGESRAPLIMRQESYDRGYCLLCHDKVNSDLSSPYSCSRE